MEKEILQMAMNKSTSFSKQQAEESIKVLKKWFWSYEKKCLELAKILNNK